MACRGFGDPVDSGLSAGAFVEDLLAGLVQTKGSGLSFQWETQQSIRVSSSATEVKLVLVKALRLSTANQHSNTRSSHDELVGVKCRCQRRRFLWASQSRTGWLLWADRLSNSEECRPGERWSRCSTISGRSGQSRRRPPRVLTPIEDLLACYRRHLIEDRDLAPSTVVSYEAQARLFLAELKGDGREEARVEALSGADVNGFLLSECTRVSVGSAKNRVNALRSLLRFLHIEGRIRANLAAAVPPVAGWRDTALPSTLTVSQVSELVSSCDRSEPVGLRDFAILMLLARLGLRCCEVVGLALDDIHWRVGELTVRGKGSGGERLPLLADVGEALAAYLGAGRGEANTRRVFLTSLAPRRGSAAGFDRSRRPPGL